MRSVPADLKPATPDGQFERWIRSSGLEVLVEEAKNLLRQASLLPPPGVIGAG